MYNHLKPNNILGQSGGWSIIPAEKSARIERDLMIREHGIDFHNAAITHTIVNSRLVNGFAVPNSSIAWSMLFSGLSDADYDRLSSIPGIGPGDYYDREDLFLRAVTAQRDFGKTDALGYWSVNRLAAHDADFLLGLQIINVGTTKKADYTSFGYACRKLIELQIGDIGDEEMSKMAKPEFIRKNIHEYIDLLVRANNEVQEFASYIRNGALDFDVEFAHNMKYSDEQIEAISKSPPAILFANGDVSANRRLASSVVAAACPV